MNPKWVESIHKQCRKANIPFFFKQWGGVRKDITGRVLHGRLYDEMPDSKPIVTSVLLPIVGQCT
jgi:protein gp37